ncbi:hypothetical protein J6590_009710 [Homalodisca vitripennis]|nr:hypothetical protein J6590_009710 [Homalodisca vitripennis]
MFPGCLDDIRATRSRVFAEATSVEDNAASQRVVVGGVLEGATCFRVVKVAWCECACEGDRQKRKREKERREGERVAERERARLCCRWKKENANSPHVTLNYKLEGCSPLKANCSDNKGPMGHRINYRRHLNPPTRIF